MSAAVGDWPKHGDCGLVRVGGHEWSMKSGQAASDFLYFFPARYFQKFRLQSRAPAKAVFIGSQSNVLI